MEENKRTYVYIQHANVYLVAVTLKNANAPMLLEFLYKLVSVFREYFKDVQEESIRDNFVIVYELLDEMMDFGFPQVSESKVLQEVSASVEFASSSVHIATAALTVRRGSVWPARCVYSTSRRTITYLRPQGCLSR